MNRMCFTLADSRAELIPMMPPGEIMLDEAKSAPGKAKPAERNRDAMRLFEKCINTNGIAGVGIAGILKGISE